MTPLEEIKLALQAIEDSRRVLVCHPRDQLVCELAAAGYPLVEVRPNDILDPGTVYLVDPNAIEAGLRAALQHDRPRFFEIPPQPWPDLSSYYRNPWRAP